MSRLKAIQYGMRGEQAEFSFKDESRLILVPYRNWSNIEGFDSAIIYQGGTLEALATDRPRRYARDEESGFWSRGRITQQRLAAYLGEAVKVGQQIYTQYTRGKIKKPEWAANYWELWRTTSECWSTREALEQGTKRVFEMNPGRFRERLEGRSLLSHF